jgi:uncharacterized surface protein with fasciclin (FAS1) repeats
MKTSLRGLLGGVMAMSMLLMPVAVPQANAASKPDIVDTAVAAGSFKTLVAAVKAADLVTTLKGPGPYTVFAPTDEAFSKLPPGLLDKVLKDKTALKNLLFHHSIAGNVGGSDLATMKSVSVLYGRPLPIIKVGKQILVCGSKVLKEVETGNGTIHVIDQVILSK